jgi:hypothetical protein
MIPPTPPLRVMGFLYIKLTQCLAGDLSKIACIQPPSSKLLLRTNIDRENKEDLF